MTRPTEAQVREVGLDQRARVAEVIATSFGEDPALRWMLGGDASPARIRAWIDASCHLLHENDQPMLAIEHEGRVLGAALISDARTSWSTVSEARWVARLVRDLGLGVARRSVRHATTSQQHQPTQPFTYLMMVASHPEARGQGYGAALIQAIIERSQAEPASTGVQLETEKESLVRYYQGFGFEVRERFEVGGIHTHSMFRPRNSPTD